MAEPTRLERLQENRKMMYEGMCKVGTTRDIWQNNLLWWVCKALYDLTDIKISEMLKNKTK